MRTCRKFVSTLLAVVFIVTSLACNVFATEDVLFSGENEDFSWSVDKDGNMVVVCYGSWIHLENLSNDVYQATKHITVDASEVDKNDNYRYLSVYGSEEFSNCDLEFVDSSDSITYLKIDGFSYMTSFDIPYQSIHYLTFDDVGITSFESSADIINYSFSTCSDLTSVAIGGDETMSISVWDCPLTSLEVPDSLEELSVYGATGLTDIELPDGLRYLVLRFTGITDFEVKSGCERVFLSNNDDLASVEFEQGCRTVTGGVCMNCENLTDVTIPDSVTAIEYSAFRYCTSLASVDIPESVMSIEDEAFAYCSSLRGIEIPSGVEYLGDNAFSFSAIETAVVPDGITTIEYGLFENCKSLTAVAIPASVESIYANAFYNDNALTDIYYDGSEEDWNNISFLKDDRRLYAQVAFEQMESLNDAIGNAVVHFAVEPHDISVECDGSAWCEVESACAGREIEVFYETDNYTDLDEVLVIDDNGDEVDFDYESMTFIMPDSSVTVYVTFKEAEYSIVCSSGDVGSVVSSVASAHAGDEVTLEAIPGFGYKFIAWRVSSEFSRVVEVTDGKFTMPNCTVFAEAWFERLTSDWAKDADGNWYYFDEHGFIVTGWRNIGGKYYFFNSDGQMQKGWVQDGTAWYYMNSDGTMVKGWKKISGKWYYFDASGAMVKGWKKIDTKYYYFNNNGAMQTGWLQDGGKWYFLNADGSMAKGWKKDNGKWYYLDGTGAMVTGWKKISGVYYYFNDSGVMQTGWVDYNGDRYYMDESGAMVSGTEMEIDGVKYYFDSDGVAHRIQGQVSFPVRGTT